VSFNGSANISIALDDLSDVTLVTPVVDEVLKYNGVVWVNGAATHNQLGGLQGGAATEYFHSTSAEYTGTGTGVFVRATSPALVTPDLGTPSALVGTNITGTATNFTVGTSQKTDALNSATTIINVSSSPAPSAGQVLTAQSGTAAIWETPATGGTADIYFYGQL
jgi:hypothetical protein